MAFRTLEITKPSEIHVKGGQMTIEQAQGTACVPLEDLHNVICMGANIRMSTMAMSKLAEKEITVMMLDEKYKVSSLLVPVDANSRQTEIMYKQIAFGNTSKNEMWHEIIRMKIRNQARVLSILGLDGAEELMRIAEKQKIEDIDVCEAYAAKVYFQYLHPGLNRRNEEPFNSHLNYGYAILRNTIIRELFSTGLQPALGIHHCNLFNAFNLADDLIEPWRPMVDLIAFYNVDSNVILTKKQRNVLAHVIHNACRMNGDKINILTGIERMVDSVKRIICSDRGQLLLPITIPIESMELLNE